MRGATVKNVKLVYGLVVYTGMETKMMMTLKYTEGTSSQSSYGDFNYGSTVQVKKNQFNQVIIKKDNEFIRQSLKYMQHIIIISYFIILVIVFLIGLHESYNLYFNIDEHRNNNYFDYLGFLDNSIKIIVLFMNYLLDLLE